MVMQCGCGRRDHPPAAFSAEPGADGYDQAVATKGVAVFVDGAYRGAADAYDVEAGWAIVDGERIEGEIRPDWL